MSGWLLVERLLLLVEGILHWSAQQAKASEWSVQTDDQGRILASIDIARCVDTIEVWWKWGWCQKGVTFLVEEVWKFLQNVFIAAVRLEFEGESAGGSSSLVGVSFVASVEEVASSIEKTVSIVKRKWLEVVQGVSFTSRMKRALWSDHCTCRRPSHIVEGVGDGNSVGLAGDKLELSLDLFLLAFEIGKLLR